MCYYTKSVILMKKFSPSDVKLDESWRIRHQIVLPQSYCDNVLSIAHDIPLAGHLGVNKTTDRILQQFFWPGIRGSIAKHCKTCHTTHAKWWVSLTRRYPVLPYIPISAFDEAFSKVIIDCVGPLPKIKASNEYLLTIMCSSTRFPEAIPLQNIKAKRIVTHLVKYFRLSHALDVAKKEVYTAVMTAQESKLQEFTADFQSESGRKNCFRIAKQMAREGRDVISVCCMKNDAGNVVSDADGMKNIWRKYIEKLLNVENDWDGDVDCPEVMGPHCLISEEEVAAAIKGLKIGKAAGPTGVVSEMMKAAGGFGSRWMTDLINNIVKEGYIPDDWRKSILVPVYKGKGDPLVCGSSY